MLEMSNHQMTRMSTSIIASTSEVNLRDMREAFPDLNPDALAKTVNQIVRACFDLGVSRSDCIAQIVRAHVAGGHLALNPKLASPLRRRGFAEHERVAAYLRGFSDGRRRIRLFDEI